MNSFSPIFFVFFGLVATALFHFDIYFPIWMSVATMIAVSLYFINKYRQNTIGLLMLLLWLVYALPFIHIIPYLWFDFTQTDPLRLWGLAVNDYMMDKVVIELTAMLGAVGAVGVALGISLNANPIQKDSGKNPDGSRRTVRTMSFPLWLIWVLVGVMLSWMVAPEDTLFTAAYTMSVSRLDGAGFSSAWMVSYVILGFAFCDSLFEENRSLKTRIILVALVVVVGFFQILRGDRESIPFVFALTLVYFYWASGITQRRDFRVPFLKIGLVIFGLLAVSALLGALRHSLVGASILEIGGLVREMNKEGDFGGDALLSGTWSATLLTPLSVAGDHIYGLLELKLGKNYIDFILSIPPGFIADAFGYVRPLDLDRGPAWEMRFGIGGTHAVVVPFMNFRMLGVFLIPAIWSFAIAKYEKFALRSVNVISLSLLVTIAMAAPHWLWYGEKAGFNAIVLWIIFSFFYRISIGANRPKKMIGGGAPFNNEGPLNAQP